MNSLELSGQGSTGTAANPGSVDWPGVRHAGHHRARPAASTVGRPALIFASVLAVLVPLVTITGIEYPGRSLLAIAYLVLLPGIPVAGLVRLPDRLARACVSIALSLAVQLLVSMSLLLVGAFGAPAVQVVVSAISLFAVTRCWRRTSPGPGLAERSRTAAASAGTVLKQGIVPAGGLAIVLVLWVIGVKTADPTAMNGYGLISILNPALLGAIALLALVAVIELRRTELRSFWLAAVAVPFVLILQGTSSAIEPVAGFPVGWLHMSFAEYITDHGVALTGFDARFSWPAFFALLSVTATSTGFSDGAELLKWAPPFGDLLMLLPLMLLTRSLSPSKRAMWLAPLLFAVGNWFQQDYLSPQQMAWFLMLTVVALLVWSARSDEPGAAGGRLPSYLRRPTAKAQRLDGMDGAGYLRLLAVVLVILAAIVVTHQLTPVMLVIFLLVLAYARRTRFPQLWVVLALMTVLWIAFGATAFWAGHLGQIFGSVGSLGTNLSSGVTARVSGSPEHLQMQTLRIAFCGVLLVLAIVGLFRLRRSGSLLVTGGLALSPFLLVALQSYGGEVLLRCFVFALPALSIAAAQVLAPLLRPNGLNRVLPIGVTLAWVVLLLLSLIQLGARGANAPFERVTASQLAAVDAIDQVAEPRATIAALDSFSPLGRLEPALYRTVLVTTARCGEVEIGASCVSGLQPDFFYVSSSTDAYGQLVEGRPADFGEQVANQLLAAGHYSLLFHSDDVTVLIHNTLKDVN